MLFCSCCFPPSSPIESPNLQPHFQQPDRKFLSLNYKITMYAHTVSLALSRPHPHRHMHTPCSRCWQATEQLWLINRLICRPLCSVLFSFNKVLLCYCYRRRENMKKCRKLLRHSTALTNHTSYCCVRAITARQVHACECVFVCEVGAFVLLRVLWQPGRCE